jgi:hypothetical protein
MNNTKLVQLVHRYPARGHRQENMKSILLETVLVGEALLFWAMALPAAAVFFPVVALWEKIGAAMPSGPIIPVGPQLTPALS